MLNKLTPGHLKQSWHSSDPHSELDGSQHMYNASSDPWNSESPADHNYLQFMKIYKDLGHYSFYPSNDGSPLWHEGQHDFL